MGSRTQNGAELKTFEQAFAAGEEAVNLMNSSNVAARLAQQNNPDGVEELQQQADDNRSEALRALQAALNLADRQTPVDKLNRARYYLSVLLYEEKETFDAAVLAEFLATKYPESEFAPTAAKVALAAYEQLAAEARASAKQGISSASDAGAYETAKLGELAQLIATRWPQAPEAAAAANLMIQTAIRESRLDEAEALLAPLELSGAPPALQAVAALAGAELALRSLRIADARVALESARDMARHAGVPALQAEVEAASGALVPPAARRAGPDGGAALRLDEVAALRDSGALVVDACRRGAALGATWLPLARRPILFALLRGLAEAWPGDAARDALIASVFRSRHADDTHRARLRVELGRLRAVLAPVAGIVATTRGFQLQPHDSRDVALLVPPIEGAQASLLALLADGEAWSTSALALALGASQRNVQRALARMQDAGDVRCVGRARARRWLAPPIAGFTTILLLPAALPQG
jgi:hypothetical protein